MIAVHLCISAPLIPVTVFTKTRLSPLLLRVAPGLGIPLPQLHQFLGNLYFQPARTGLYQRGSRMPSGR